MMCICLFDNCSVTKCSKTLFISAEYSNFIFEKNSKFFPDRPDTYMFQDERLSFLRIFLLVVYYVYFFSVHVHVRKCVCVFRRLSLFSVYCSSSLCSALACFSYII